MKLPTTHITTTPTYPGREVCVVRVVASVIYSFPFAVPPFA